MIGNPYRTSLILTETVPALEQSIDLLRSLTFQEEDEKTSANDGELAQNSEADVCTTDDKVQQVIPSEEPHIFCSQQMDDRHLASQITESDNQQTASDSTYFHHPSDYTNSEWLSDVAVDNLLSRSDSLPHVKADNSLGGMVDFQAPNSDDKLAVPLGSCDQVDNNEIPHRKVEEQSLFDQLEESRSASKELVAVNHVQEQQLHALKSELTRAKTVALEEKQEFQQLCKKMLAALGKIIIIQAGQGMPSDPIILQSNKAESTQAGDDDHLSMADISKMFEHRLERILQNVKTAHLRTSTKMKKVSFAIPESESNMELRDDHLRTLRKLIKAENLVQSLKEENQETVDRMEKLRQNQKTTRSQLLTATDQLESAQVQNKKLQVRLGGLRQEATTAASELQETRSRLKSCEKEKRNLQGQLENVQLQLDRAQGLRQKAKTAASELQETQVRLKSSEQEKSKLQRQLENVLVQLDQAQHEVRSLDHLTRFQLEVRQEWLYGPIRRATRVSGEPPSIKVVKAVKALNESISEIASTISHQLECSEVERSGRERAKTVLGEWITSMLEKQVTKPAAALPQRQKQILSQVFLVVWCSAIIEAAYPKKKTFSDLLFELSAQGAENIKSGKHEQVIQGTTWVNFMKWVGDILVDLSQVLLVGGLDLRSGCLECEAYTLRTAFAERDVCGNLELHVPTPGTNLATALMEDEDVYLTENEIANMKQCSIAGTTAIGLRVARNQGKQRRNARDQKYDVILNPKVVLDDLTTTITLRNMS
ncbi:hypothetical protein CPB84DRAFT_1761619 [Gymnopilus junonius]|uniref:Uncharacterized protein n=1 Tax=Gymnopilus junonius TaxID=109634 RepID=A0A9P5TU06_GYMJU|nr:hypothetical protein CPB84DRAFT_1761619 [Gymnopilus junonius]